MDLLNHSLLGLSRQAGGAEPEGSLWWQHPWQEESAPAVANVEALLDGPGLLPPEAEAASPVPGQPNWVDGLTISQRDNWDPATGLSLEPVAAGWEGSAAPRDPILNPGSSGEAGPTRELLILDGGIDNLEQLLAAVRPGVEVAVLDRDRDGISQISALLSRASDLDAVHLVSHGQAGSLQLGSSRLDATALAGRAAEIALWGQAFTASGDLLLYGCNMAADATGVALIHQLAALTGADVAASDDPTGSSLLGGDWDLEERAGTIEQGLAFLPAVASLYEGLLAAQTAMGTAGNDAITIGINGSNVRVSLNGFDMDYAFASLTTLTIDAREGDDTITINDLTGWNGTLVINGGPGTDNVSVSADVNFELSDSTLKVGSRSISLSGIESATLTGGTSANTFTVSGWSGTAELDGKGGDDRYVLGANFGTVNITNAVDEGTDTLDFTGHDNLLTLTNGGLTFTSADGVSSLTQVGLAEEIDAQLPSGGAIAALETFLDNLLNSVEDLQSGGAAIAELINALPLLGGSGDTSLAKLSGLTDAIQGLVNAAKSALINQPTLSAVVGALNGLASPGDPFTTWSFAVSTSYRGADAAASGPEGALELILDLVLQAKIDNQTFSFDLGEPGALLGAAFSAKIRVDTELDARLSVGLSTASPLEVFLVPGSSIALSFDANADLAGTALNLGFLSLGFEGSSTVGLDGRITLTFQDDAALQDGRIDLAAVASGTTPLSAVTNIVVDDPDPADGGYLSVNLTPKVSSGLLAGGVDLSIGSVNLELDLPALSNPFGTAAGASGINLSALEVTLPGAGSAIDLLDFSNISATEVMGMLGGVLDMLAGLASSQALKIPIPYSNNTLGDILNFGRSFKEDVLDPLFRSGDFLRPDLNGDGAISLPFFDNNKDGIIDEKDAELAELRIGNIQDLVARLGAYLGLPELTANLSNNEVTFTIDFSRSFGLGKGSVISPDQGTLLVTVSEGRSGQNEVQRLLLAPNVTGGSFRLTYLDQTTAEIAWDASAATLQARLEALTDIGAGNVAVSQSNGGYTITFQGALAGKNVAALGVVPDRLSLNTSLQTQVLRLDPSTTAAFRLSFRDAGGDLAVTAPITVTSGNLAALPAAIKTALEAAGLAGQVAAVAGENGLYTILFNSPQERLGFAGELGLNFGTSLGDFAGFSTEGSFALAGLLDTSFSFGIDLSPDTAVRVLPPVFTPSTPPGILSADASFSLALYDAAASAALRTLTINVPASVTHDNATPADLALDVQRAIDQALFDSGFTIGFDPSAASSPGFHTTGTIVAGSTFTAAAAPFGGGAIPSDLAFNVVVPLAAALSTTTEGVLDTTKEVQQLVFTARSGSFTLSNGTTPTAALSFNASAAAVQAALETLFGEGNVIVSQTIEHLNGDGLKETRYTISFDQSLANVDALIVDTSKLQAYTYTGSVRLAQIIDNGLERALETAINQLLKSTSITVAVASDAGKLTVTPTDGSIELRFRSAILASAGGGRISLDAPAVKLSSNPLERATEVARRLEITVDYDNPAFQEMGIAGSPTRFDGTIPHDIHLTLKVNGKDVNLFLAAASTAGNTSLDQLVGQLQSALDTALLGQGFMAGAVQVLRLGLNPDDPASAKGNRLSFEGLQGVVSELAIVVPDVAGGNGAVTALGFELGASETKRSKASSFFLEDVTLKANLGLFENDIKARASLGLLAVTGELSANLDGSAGKLFGVDVNLALVRPSTGESRLSIDQIFAAINAGQFLFNGDVDGDSDANPETGFIDGTIKGGVDLAITLQPDGVIAGLQSLTDLGSLSVNAQSDNWLLGSPSLNVSFSKPSGLDDLFNSLKSLSFDDIVAVLRQVVVLLQRLETGSGIEALNDVFRFKLPVIERSIGDLVDLSGDFIDFVDSLARDPQASLQALEAQLRTLLGLPKNPSIEFPAILSFDLDSKNLYFNFGFASSTSTTRPVSLNLADANLGPLSSLVGLGAGGNFGVAAGVDLNLKLGLDLDGPDKAFFIDVDGTKLEAHASAFGDDLNFKAALGPIGIFVKEGSGSLNAGFLLELLDVGSSTNDGRLILAGFGGSGLTSDLAALGDALKATITGMGTIDLPLFYGLESSPVPMVTTPGGSNSLKLDLDLVKLFNGESGGFELTMPDFSFDQLALPSLFSLLSDPSVVVQGLNTVLKEIQGILQGEIFGFKLPFIGDALKDNPVAAFIEDFRLDFLRPLAKTISESNLNLQGLIDLIEDVIWDVFGSDGLNLLPALPDNHRFFKFLRADGSITASPLDAQAIQFDFDLGGSFTRTLTNLDFDLGIPLLNLKGEINPTLEIDWGLHLGFGLDLSKGFYFVSDFDGNNEPELTFNLELNLGSTSHDPATLEATLLLLKLQLTDGLDVRGGVDPEFTRLFLEASLDIRDFSGGGENGDESDGKLTIAELISQTPLGEDGTFKFEIAGGAQFLASAELNLGGLGNSGGLSLGSVLPSISADLLASIGIAYNTDTGLELKPPEVALANVSLDLGDFIDGFAGDVLKTIGEVLEPLAFLIGPDGLLNLRLPLISDLLGQTVRIRDLINLYDPKNGPKVNAFLEFVETLYFLTDLVDAAADGARKIKEGLLNFGSLVLFENKSGDSFFADIGNFLGDIKFDLGLGIDADLSKIPKLGSLTLPTFDPPDLSTQPEATKSFTSGITNPGSIEFPILKPETIFGLLLGKPATIFTVELPELGFEFLYRQVIPIIGPLAATFAGKFGGNLDLGFGYDTLGLNQFIATDNPAFLLNGFFLNDIDPATGLDRPELTFGAEIAVGAALSLGVASAGVEGGISANIFFDLNDPDLDGKVRFAELASNILANSGNPLAIFDVSGVVEFFLRAYIEVLFFEANFEFARLKLFEFNIDFERPGVLATQSGDSLILNIGPNAAARIQGDISDGDEEIFVKSIGEGVVVVWSDKYGVSEFAASTNPFTGVKTIVARGGLGNDLIDLSGVHASHNISAVISGGEGNDTIIGGGGNDQLSGDDGDDTIHGGDGDDTIRGGRGNDTIYGGDGNDDLFGDDGDDWIDGGDGDDTIRGGRGNDLIQRSAGNDQILLTDAGSIDMILGSAGTPTLDLSGKTVPVTVFMKDDRILVGFGQQAVDTATILNTTFTFNTATDLANQFTHNTPAFAHMIGVVGTADIHTLIGTAKADIFHIQSTSSSSEITLNGGLDADIYNFYADPTGANPIQAIVHDLGEGLKDQNLIRVIGSAATDHISITSTEISLNETSGNQIIRYVPPADLGSLNAFSDQLAIQVFGNAGDDHIHVKSTAITVPVRVEGGLGDDTITVGHGTVNDLQMFLNPNANNGFGLGPLVIVGNEGHDTVIVDDSADSGVNVGASGAFREVREGIGPVEVGVVAGLGMGMYVRRSDESDPVQVDGHLEIEGVEVLQVKLGSGADTFVVGGSLITDRSQSGAGGWSEIALTSAVVPITRLENTDPVTSVNGTTNPSGSGFGIVTNLFTISGMTLVEGGEGSNDIRVLRTQALPDQQDEASTRVTVNPNITGPGGSTTQLDIRADVGYFVLEFNDPGTIRGGEQTVVLPYTVSAADLEAALAALRLVGDASLVTVSEIAAAAGARRSFTISFDARLGALPNLQAFDTKLLLVGGNDNDRISIQSIDQPTYVLGKDGLDVLNVNVEIGVGGPLPGAVPEGLTVLPPAKTSSNGVNSLLTVDGGDDDDRYFVYLLGGSAESLINLYDSGSSTGDKAYLFGTEADDLFLLRAAVADDGLAFVAMIKPPVGDAVSTAVERVNYRKQLDAMEIFALGGNDSFGIDDTRIEMIIHGGEGEDFFQIGQLYKSRRNAAAGIPFADAFGTIETTRGYLSNGISQAMKIFGGEGNDEFVVYHNLAPLALFGEEGDDSFLIRAFALAGSQEDLRERTDISGGAGADLIEYAVSAPVFIDGGDGFDTVIVIGTEFNDDFVITENGVFGAGLNVTFVRVETVEVDGDAGDDRFFIAGTKAGVITRLTGGLGSDTFFANGPTPDVVSNDLLGHSGLISHLVGSNLATSLYAGIKVAGIAANVVDDDEPAIRITITDGSSVVSQLNPNSTDSYSVVLTRKPENGATVVVTSRAPAGVKFVTPDGVSDGGSVSADGDTITFHFDSSNWYAPQRAFFSAFQTGSAVLELASTGSGGGNALQVLALQGSEGSFRITSSDPALGGSWTSEPLTFDVRGLSSVARDTLLDALATAIQTAIQAQLTGDAAVTVSRVLTTFFIEFEGVALSSGLQLSDVAITFNDIVGTSQDFITHTVSIQGASSDALRNLFLQSPVAGRRDGSASVITTTEGGGGSSEVQQLSFDASDGNFRIQLGTQISEEMLFLPYNPLDPASISAAVEGVRLSIATALNAFSGVEAEVVHVGPANAYTYELRFQGSSAGLDVPPLEVLTSNLVRGERSLRISGGLPSFITDQGDDILRGATVTVVAGAGVGQTRLVIGNDANRLVVATPWGEALDATSRIEILRYEGVKLAPTLVQIVGDDGFAIDLRESGGGTLAFEAPEVHGFSGNGDTSLNDNGFFDTVTVSLTQQPTGPVTVSLDGRDNDGIEQLFFAIWNGSSYQVVTSLSFSADSSATDAWNKVQTLFVFAIDDTRIEGLHKASLTLTADGGGYTNVTNAVVVTVADNEVPLAMVIESDGSTNVVETGNALNGGLLPLADGNGVDPTTDSYRVVLSQAPQAGETVTVQVQADPTRTQRGAGLLGIRAFEEEVLVNGASSASLTFTADNWFTTQTVTVTAAPDSKVDGSDSKSFAKGFDLANSIQGPLEIIGGLSEDRSADLEREPVMLPGETNLKASIGTVQAVPTGIDGDFSLTINLDERTAGEVMLDTRGDGGTAGIAAVIRNTVGDAGNAIQEVQVLTIEAISGTFALSYDKNDDGAIDASETTDAILYNRGNLAATANAIQTALNTLLGADGPVTVAVSGDAFRITFTAAGTRELIGVHQPGNNLIRVGGEVDTSAANGFSTTEQQLTLFGNGGTFTLQLDLSAYGGSATATTAAIAFSPDQPGVDQASRIATALNALLAGTAGTPRVTVSGSGSTYLVRFNADPAKALVVSTTNLRVDEIQTLTLNASGGSFRLSLDGLTSTAPLAAATLSASTLQTALEALSGGAVTVVKDPSRPVFTILFNGGTNVAPLQLLEADSLDRTVKEALENALDITINEPADLEGFALEITRGEAKNKVRLVIGSSDPDTSPASGLTVLEIARPWQAGLTDQVPLAGVSQYTLEKVNPNLLVDENEETDVFFLYDSDNVSDASLTVTANRLSGLGMGGDQTIGGRPIAGGIHYSGLEELVINLGSGANTVTITDTHSGNTTIHAGDGDDRFVVERVSGHTFLNGGAGADRVEVGQASRLAGINALLTVTGDVAQAVALTLAKGSGFDPLSGTAGADEIQQISVDATGGSFRVGFIRNGIRHFTDDLAHNVSAAALQAALQALLPEAFGYTADGIADVEVTRSGNVYRIAFIDQMGQRDVPLLAIDDRGLTMETGAGSGDTLVIDNSADTADTQALLTATALTGLGMGNLGTAGTSFNEIQTLRLHATAGTFSLGITGHASITSGDLAFDISAAALDVALEAMLLAYLNAERAAAGVPPLSVADTAGGLVEVARNDDVYVFRFVGLLSNFDVAQLTVDASALRRSEEWADGTIVEVQGTAQTATRLDGITAASLNEIQQLTITATGGSFRLAFPSLDATTAELAWNLSAADLQLALEALPAIAPGDVRVTATDPGVFQIEFGGQLSATDLAALLVTGSTLTGGSASVSTLQHGQDTGLNDQQVLTVAASEGFFQLELYLPALRRSLTTEALAHDASAEDVRRALQLALARLLNGLEADADLARTREAFKSDFSVARIGNTYHITFQGVARQRDGGEGVSLLKVIGDDSFTGSGGASVLTRMDGINYYGFERIDIKLGSGADILNVQGTSAGSFRGINAPLDAVLAATNIALGDGDDRVFLSSNADLDINTDRTTAGQSDVFEFLTGDLEAFAGNLNLDLGAGRHRLLISDEGDSSGDTVTISDRIVAARGAGSFDEISAAEIQIKGLAFGDITYGAAADGNLFDGVITWTGSGHDTVEIDGTHYRAGERTTTLLNTGLGDDTIIVALDAPGQDSDEGDGFFVLNTMGGRASHGTDTDAIALAAAGASDNDVVRAAASSLPLIIFGGLGEDDIIGGQAGDVIFGDFGRIHTLDSQGNLVASFGFGGRDDRISSLVLDPTWVISRHFNLGDRDILEGQGGHDILVGGTVADAGMMMGVTPRFDYLDGGSGEDLIFGDAVQLQRRIGDITDPRYRALTGEVIYGRSDLTATQLGQAVPSETDSGAALVEEIWRDARNQSGTAVADWHEYLIVNLYHSAAILAGDEADLAHSFSADYIAGGAGNDRIFGQLGNDVIQGDGSIASAVGAPNDANGTAINRLTTPQADLVHVGAQRVLTGQMLALTSTVSAPETRLVITPSFEADTDGDDYIEGNGGDDVIFGNLGQDDIVGDNSSLFSLIHKDQREPSGSDLIFGGAGTRIGRNDYGQATADADGNVTLELNGHARDADVIAGDNANIYRLVGVNNAEGAGLSGIGFAAGFLTFTYDTDEARGTQRIIPRAVELLDYTPGGPDHNPAASDDFGDNDEIHGEGGDDVIYGMAGDDVLFGDGQDDDLIGGWGNDWISGGTGQDGVIGDDGRLFTSRNGLVEKLNGLFTANIQTTISTPGKLQEATIYSTGSLLKAADLTPFSQDPSWDGSTDEWNNGADAPHSNDDIIYGGLGSDFLHGGSGDDAISGAEALTIFFDSPVNPGDVLQYGVYRPGEFASYDEYAPRAYIPGFFLNFDPSEGVKRPGGSISGGGNQATSYPEVYDDGDDRIFGGLGNDWLVGGTGRDHLYGGWGDDLLNADDDHGTTGGSNDAPDTHPSYEDRAYGGAGRDILIGNTGGDRLIDWVGEFNSYIVPFAPFGAATISRTLQPQLPGFLYALGAADGADPTRGLEYRGSNSDPRKGEPAGELGLVLQSDAAWQRQTGAPSDPQAGNAPGGPRDVLRSSNFNDGTQEGFAADSGIWEVSRGALQVAASSPKSDAVAVYNLIDPLPAYFEMAASVQVLKPTAGWSGNSYLVFDYRSATDFKYAGVDVSTNRLVIGQRTDAGWQVLVQTPFTTSLKADTWYSLLLSVNHHSVSLSVNNRTTLSHTFSPTVIDGVTHALNWGMVGIGSNRSRGAFDNLRVQVAPPTATVNQRDDFTTGTGPMLTAVAGSSTGLWQPANGRLDGSPTGSSPIALQLLNLSGITQPASWSLLEVSTTLRTGAQAGIVFDHYGPNDFKYAALDPLSKQLVIGHRSGNRWVVDAAVKLNSLSAGTDYTLGVAIQGSRVTLLLNGSAMLSHTFNAVAVDGRYGLFATGTPASFDMVQVRSNDPAIPGGPIELLLAAAAAEPGRPQRSEVAALTEPELLPLRAAALERLRPLLNGEQISWLESIAIVIADLPDQQLGAYRDGVIWIDTTAAGHGWFLDPTPSRDEEFQDRAGTLQAIRPLAMGRIDLLTVLLHELAHAAGLAHGEGELMTETLATGVRALPADAAPTSVALRPLRRPKSRFHRR